MSLFDQQPMGPVPARHPIMMPPDPELEAAVDDPASVEVTLVGPVPRELADAAEPGLRRLTAWQVVRVAFVLLLVAPSIYGLCVWTIQLVLGGDALDDQVRVPALFVAAGLVVVITIAHAWWRRVWRSRLSQP